MKRSSNTPGAHTYESLGAVFAAAIIVLLCIAAAPAAAQSPSPEKSSQATEPARVAPAISNAQEYVVSPDDVLDVYILDVPELSRTYRVSPTGQLTMPLVTKPFAAAGMTLDQLSQAITTALKESQLVTSPRVSVTVRESRMHSVAITGAVKKPQIYFVFGRTTLLDVISQAEGLSSEAGSAVNITRGEIARRVLANRSTDGEAPSAIETVDLEKLLATGDPNLNVDIYPGDRVTVAQAGVVYVVGAVNKPGGFALTANRKQLSVLQAVALAEDVKSTAVRNKAMIVRRGPNLADRHEIPVPLKDILSGKSADIALQPNDIFFIPDSSGKKAMRRGAEAAIQIATGVLIYRP